MTCKYCIFRCGKCCLRYGETVADLQDSIVGGNSKYTDYYALACEDIKIKEIDFSKFMEEEIKE